MLEFNTESKITSSNQQLYNFEELLGGIDDAFIATDEQFVITHWNKAAERIYGITAVEAIGANRTDLLQYEYIGSTFFEVIKELKTSDKWKGILKFIKSDNTAVFLQSSATVLRNVYGDITGYVAINRDITQQYLSEQSLQNFTTILHYLDESFLITDRNMRIVFLSPKKNVISFHQSSYKVGDHALKFIPDTQKEEILQNYQKAFAGATISHEAESEGDADTKIYLHVTYMPLRNSYGAVTHVTIIIKDLTYEKRKAMMEQQKKDTEAQLYQSRLLFEEFMENCLLPAWVTDAGGNIQYLNPTYLKQFQFTKEDIGKNVNQLFPQIVADDFCRNNMQVLTSNKAITTIEQVKKADSGITTYYITKFPLQYQGQTMIAGWGMDITEQVKMQQQLEESNACKDKILAVVAHDLRSPLAVISSVSHLVSEDPGGWSREELLELFDNVNISNSKALALLKELMLWGQSKMNKVSYLPRQINVAEQIAEAVAFLQVPLQEKNITVDYRLEQHAEAYADVDMLKTIIRNLVSNAIKFSPPASVITITTSITESDVYVSVADEGTGIDDELKSRILRGTNNTSAYGTKGEKGIGIGLNICKDFIESNKGVLTISNNKIKGTVFSFSVPKFLSLPA